LSNRLHHTRTRHDAQAREVIEIEGASHGFAVSHAEEVAEVILRALKAVE
jgi:pimeloyl-ACP methyl ester carboxylesterase